MKPLDPDLTPQELDRLAYAKTIELLAAREHSCFEIRHKLKQRGFGSSEIEKAIQQACELNYLSDERFASEYARQLGEKLYGPFYIHSKMFGRGIDNQLVSSAINSLGYHWPEQAALALAKQFQLTTLQAPTTNERSRLARFLKNRGFSSSDSIKALRIASECLPE